MSGVRQFSYDDVRLDHRAFSYVELWKSLVLGDKTLSPTLRHVLLMAGNMLDWHASGKFEGDKKGSSEQKFKSFARQQCGMKPQEVAQCIQAAMQLKWLSGYKKGNVLGLYAIVPDQFHPVKEGDNK